MCGRVGGGVVAQLKQLVRFSCRLMFNVILIVIRDTESRETAYLKNESYLALAWKPAVQVLSSTGANLAVEFKHIV